jgi:hypothetical protein
MLIDLTYIQNISVKRIRYGFSTSFSDKNYLPVSYSLEMPVPSQGHYGFHSFPVVD